MAQFEFKFIVIILLSIVKELSKWVDQLAINKINAQT